MPKFKAFYHIKENYKELLDKNIYELLLCEIMNESKIVFPDKYKQILEQSNGESDFVSDGGEFLDAKLLFYSQQALNIKKHDIDNFMKSIQTEQNEVYDTIVQEKNVSDNLLFVEIKKRLEKMKKNENLIIFLPFDVTGEVENSFFSYCQSDIFSYIIDEMRREFPLLVNNHIIYMICPNVENKIVLKCYNKSDYKIEFLHTDKLRKYIEMRIEMG